jgi:hypothetical protein
LISRADNRKDVLCLGTHNYSEALKVAAVTSELNYSPQLFAKYTPPYDRPQQGMGQQFQPFNCQALVSLIWSYSRTPLTLEAQPERLNSLHILSDELSNTIVTRL